MTPETPTITLGLCAIATAAGILFHFVTKLGELESQGTVVTPWAYWRRHPYTSIAVIMAAYFVLGLQWQLGELGLIGALMNGIGCNALGDKLRAKAAAKTDATLEKV